MVYSYSFCTFLVYIFINSVHRANYVQTNDFRSSQSQFVGFRSVTSFYTITLLPGHASEIVFPCVTHSIRSTNQKDDDFLGIDKVLREVSAKQW